METKNEELTAQRSLEIISQTLEESRRRITQGSWKGMMLWGVSVMIIALVVGHLWKNSSMGTGANGLWGLLGVVHIIKTRYLQNKPKLPVTFVSKTIGQVWSSMGIIGGSLGFVLIFISFLNNTIAIPISHISPNIIYVYFPITSIMILFMGIAGMTTGMILHSRAITVCCYVAGILGCALALLFRGPYEMVVLAGVAFVGLVLPALIIKQKEV